MHYGLSDREHKVLHLSAQGLTDEAVAEHCDTTLAAIYWDWSQILLKTSSNSRARAMSLGLPSEVAEVSG